MIKKRLVKYFKKDKKRFAVYLLIGAIMTAALLVFSSTGINLFSNKFLARSQSLPLFYFPQFPTRLAYLAGEITSVSEELVARNEELLGATNASDCSYAQSQCRQSVSESGSTTCEPGPIKVFGEVSPAPRGVADETEPTLEEQQSAINDLNIKLASLEVTLDGEIAIGLEKQLKTLRPEDAQAIRENLEKLNQLIPEMRTLTERNSSLPNECSLRRCTPNCELGQTFTAEACIRVSGQQKPIELKFRVGVGLNDMNLGRVGVNNINLGLPNKISVPAPKLPSLNIRIPNITLTCPTQKQQITFRSPSPSLPETPNLTLSCPNYPRYSSYQCSSPPSQGEEGFIEFQWWNQTFEHLSGECLKVVQKAAELTNQLNSEQGREEYQRLIAGCLSPEQVTQTTVNECEKRWQFRQIPFGWQIPGNGAFETCRQIGHQQPPPTRNQKATEWCQKLFQDEGQTPPTACSSEPVPTTRQKCNEIRDSGRENAPLSCKLLPLFAGQLENPPEGNATGGGGNCPAQKIGDFPIPNPGCAIAAPSIPTITFPTIVVPDIRLPTFSLPPLFRVKLPNFIFEDLIIPDINLCNLDNCRAQFPYLSFRPPSLRVPQVNVPPTTLNIPGASPIDIQIEPINFPPLSFNVPQLINLGALVTPELNTPNISLPQPRIQFAFSGINIDLLNLLLGLLKTPLNLNQCVAVNAKLGILDISLPDRYFYWPKFPRVPEIPFCKDVRTFCQNAKSSIQEITGKTRQIEEKVNTVFQSQIQTKLDRAALRLNQKIKGEIERHLNEVKNEISRQLLQHLARYAPQNVIPPSPPVPGVWQVVGELPCQGIPPLTVSLPPELRTINVDSKSINEFLREEFGATWPTELTIQWPEDLRKLNLNNPLSYNLPTVPLSDLSYSKEITERLPGLQVSVTAPRDLLSGLKNARSCLSGKPIGGNPCQAEAGEIQSNLEQIRILDSQISEASKKITDVLY